MEKILEIDINDKEDLFEKYNEKKISKELIKYIIDNTPKFKKDDKIKVIINNNLKDKMFVSELIKKELDSEVARNEYKFTYNNRKQIVYFISGVAALVLSTFINIEILEEIILIGAWVVLWNMVELEIDDDINYIKKKRILKKILNSEFEEIRK